MPEPPQPEHREQRIALGKTNEHPARASLQRLVAQVLDESRGDLIRVRSFRYLQVEHLENCRPRQVKAKRLAGGLDEADDLATILCDVNQSLLRQRQQS